MRFLNHHSVTVIVLELKCLIKDLMDVLSINLKERQCVVGGGKTMTPHAAQQK